MLAKIPIGGNIVQDSYIGNTHILICDASYVNHTPEDNQHILDQLARAAMNIILRNQHDHL